ncbi:rCG42354 [Rattus norvegicus]|uniref:RCG42354 n=1 Tax=Rattus norvegicus TaxID=10116 RepID=A6KFT1_RAT|nr:rCG42354 [Rattus norvegicus]
MQLTFPSLFLSLPLQLIVTKGRGRKQHLFRIVQIAAC